MTTAELPKGHSHVAPDARSLVGDAAWLPHRLIDGDRSLRFVNAPRDVHRRVTFLSDDYLDAALPRVEASVEDLKGALAPHDTSVHFIFHSAFARSTLLARAMDLPGQAMGLKEPIILNDAAQLLREHRLNLDTLELVLGLLERPFTRPESIIIKPSNVANLLMDQLLRLRPNARAILLFRDLPSYLQSIARKGLFGRIWARRLLHTIRAEAPFNTGFSDADLFAQSDLQTAALAWLIQHAQFARLASAMPNRVRLINASRLKADRHRTFAATVDWFGLGLDETVVDTIVNGPAFTEDSKRIGQRFDGGSHGEDVPIDTKEIDMVMDWATAVAKHVGLPLHFGVHLP